MRAADAAPVAAPDAAKADPYGAEFTVTARHRTEAVQSVLRS